MMLVDTHGVAPKLAEDSEMNVVDVTACAGIK